MLGGHLEVRAASGTSSPVVAGAGRASSTLVLGRERRQAPGRRRGTRAGRSRRRAPGGCTPCRSSRQAGGKRPPWVATPTSAAVGPKRQGAVDVADDRDPLARRRPRDASRGSRRRPRGGSGARRASSSRSGRRPRIPRRGSAASRLSHAEPGLLARHLHAVDQRHARARVVGEQQVAVEVDVVAERRDDAAGRDARARTRPCSRASRRARARGRHAPCGSPRGCRPTSPA